MTDRYTTDEAESNTDWTRRSFMTALGGTGLLASTSTASAETTGCCCCGAGADIDTEALDAVIARLNAAADMLEFPARRVGSVPRGTQHGASRWGIHFRTERAIHLGRATVDAGESGSFTAVVGAYDGEDRFEPVHEREIDVDSGVNEIDLDMALEPGEYLLTREGSFPLRRGEWNGWESQSRDGLELIGGSKPGDFTKPNRYWYYFFDLNVAAHEDAHL
ncbi:hypothetical protein [Halalkalicoccus salilacus]|uniref:hypothetical protein n=1 Tax=Halalkalicoccus TaxID=332246 RepID=UPI002F9659FC